MCNEQRAMSVDWRRYNQHGALMCAADPCRKHVRLTYDYDTDLWFCKRHYKQFKQGIHFTVAHEDRCGAIGCTAIRTEDVEIYEVDGVHRCNKHFPYALDTLHDKEGNPFCHAMYCWKTRKLTYAYKRLWCKKHLKEIRAIREKISSHMNDYTELEARIEETKLNKQTDEGHLYAIDYLTAKLGE